MRSMVTHYTLLFHSAPRMSDSEMQWEIPGNSLCESNSNLTRDIFPIWGSVPECPRPGSEAQCSPASGQGTGRVFTHHQDLRDEKIFCNNNGSTGVHLSSNYQRFSEANVSWWWIGMTFCIIIIKKTPSETKIFVCEYESNKHPLFACLHYLSPH